MCIYLCIHFGYINARKPRILGIFFANCGFLLHFGGIIPKNRDIRSKIPNNYKVQLHFAGTNPKIREILAKYWQIQSNSPKTRDIRLKLTQKLGNSRQNVCKLNRIFRKIGKFGTKCPHILAKWLH